MIFSWSIYNVPSQVLKSLSSQAFNGVSELFRQYLFCVVSFFVPPSDSSAVSSAIDRSLSHT
jgi:hypothetical protein